MVLNQPTISKALAARWNEDGSENQCMSMEEFRSSESAIFWKEYASDELAALLYPNICRSLSDSYQAFGYVRDVDSFSPLQKVAIRGLGSLAMYFAASKVKCKCDPSQPRNILSTKIILFLSLLMFSRILLSQERNY
mmetsp:Transcript_33087/g.98425  ORF Transcript_33087/g.98425 Transcript_33087/m.98425 type:complete len:137 (+) Transcript_33087:601-1011(+)